MATQGEQLFCLMILIFMGLIATLVAGYLNLPMQVLLITGLLTLGMGIAFFCNVVD